MLDRRDRGQALGGAILARRRWPERIATTARWLAGATLALGSRRGSKLGLAPLARPWLREANQRWIRDRCMAVQVADGIIACRILGRFKMYVDADDRAHAPHLMFDGFWEMHVTQVVAALVRPGMVAVDVGANQGYYTLLLAGLVGTEGRVHAVEPNPRMTALLGRSVAANGLGGRVHLHSRALGASGSRRVVLHVPDGMPSGAYLEPAADEAGAMLTATLDGLLGDGSVDFIKIDAEGSEVAIWAGMQRVLARGAPLTVVMEFFVDSSPDAAGFLGDVARHGFSLHHIDNGGGLRPVTADDILRGASDQEWILVLQRGRGA